MTCLECHYKLTSKHHYNRCFTVVMGSTVKQDLSDLSKFRPMMTFGLCGCTVIFLLEIKKNTQKYIKAVLAHYSDAKEIMRVYENHYHTNSDFLIIIKLPILYVQQSGKWCETVDNTFENNIKGHNIKIHQIPYSTYYIQGELGYRSSLYFRLNKNQKLEFSDDYGRYKCINDL